MDSVVPENFKGKSLDIEHYITADTRAEAIAIFKTACTRVLNPPDWHLLAGELSATFTVYNSKNLQEAQPAAVDDYLGISVPGPGLSEGDGLDWVRVELLQTNKEPDCDESLAMQVRPSKNPLKTHSSIAHFFDEASTSTFIIRRIGKKIVASYHGRNEVANTEEVSLLDKLRNKVVATGAKAGLSNLQWEALIKGFLQPEMVE